MKPKLNPKHLYTAFIIPILLAISATSALAAPGDTIWTKANEIIQAPVPVQLHYQQYLYVAALRFRGGGEMEADPRKPSPNGQARAGIA